MIETTKRYDPHLRLGDLDVDVRIDVEGGPDEDALELANRLHDAVESTHRDWLTEQKAKAEEQE